MEIRKEKEETMNIGQLEYNYVITPMSMNFYTGIKVNQNSDSKYKDLEYLPNLSGNFTLNYFLPEPEPFDLYWMNKFRATPDCCSDSILFSSFLDYCHGEVTTNRDSFGSRVVSNVLTKLIYTLE